jgi:hypothetical protein
MRPKAARPAEPEAPDPQPEAPQASAALAPEPETTEFEPVRPAGTPPQAVGSSRQHQLDGVTESADWGWDDPGDFSAPV